MVYGFLARGAVFANSWRYRQLQNFFCVGQCINLREQITRWVRIQPHIFPLPKTSAIAKFKSGPFFHEGPGFTLSNVNPFQGSRQFLAAAVWWTNRDYLNRTSNNKSPHMTFTSLKNFHNHFEREDMNQSNVSKLSFTPLTISR